MIEYFHDSQRFEKPQLFFSCLSSVRPCMTDKLNTLRAFQSASKEGNSVLGLFVTSLGTITEVCVYEHETSEISNTKVTAGGRKKDKQTLISKSEAVL